MNADAKRTGARVARIAHAAWDRLRDIGTEPLSAAAVLAIVVWVAVPNYMRMAHETRATRDEQMLNYISHRLEAYHALASRYPLAKHTLVTEALLTFHGLPNEPAMALDHPYFLTTTPNDEYIIESGASYDPATLTLLHTAQRSRCQVCTRIKLVSGKGIVSF